MTYQQRFKEHQMGQAKVRAKEINQLKANNINTDQFLFLLNKIAGVVVLEDATHGYNQSTLTRNAAVMLIDKHNLTHKHYEQILEIRESFNQALGKKYGFELTFGLGSFLQDIDAVLKQHAVPQNIQIATGLMDTIVAVLGMRVGAVKFHHVA
jgi:hypothetical protein